MLQVVVDGVPVPQDEPSQFGLYVVSVRPEQLLARVEQVVRFERGVELQLIEDEQRGV